MYVIRILTSHCVKQLYLHKLFNRMTSNSVAITGTRRKQHLLKERRKAATPFRQEPHTHPIIYFETGAKVEAFRGASYIPENGTFRKLIFQERKTGKRNRQDRYIRGLKEERIRSNFPSSPRRAPSLNWTGTVLKKDDAFLA